MQSISNQITDRNSVALLFSGGTDSLTCLFSLLELGIKPILYSFHLENTIHKDIEVSEQVADFYQLPHNIVKIKEDIEQLQKDVCYLIKEYQISRKTNVQCTYPFLHVLPHIKENNVVTGLCADDLYGTAKSVVMKASKDKNILDKIRVKTFSDLNSSAYRSIKEMTEGTFSKKLIAPYRDSIIIDYFMKFSWEEMHKPKQKQLALNAFEDYFSKQKIYRKNSNLQVGSKIREWHDELLNTKLNANNRIRVDEIYKDIFKGNVQC
jgi:asparagine synthetase B (glutamine-hydrolysing)